MYIYIYIYICIYGGPRYIYIYIYMGTAVYIYIYINMVDRGSTAIKVLRYKSEGRWFDSRWCHYNFSLTQNPSDRNIALGSTQPLTEMSTGSISWGVKAAGA